MSPAVPDQVVSFALSMTLKASILLAAAALVQAVIRRRASAATRHMVWTLAIASVLLLPFAWAVLPAWAVATGTAPAVAVAAVPNGEGDRAFDQPASGLPQLSAGSARTVGADGTSLSVAAAAAYAAGVLVMLVLFALELGRIHRLSREGMDVQDGEWTRLLSECADRMGIRRVVRLLRSRERSMPMAFGSRRPTIVIPAIADTWAEDRRRAVVLHELAHVARYDCLTQMLAFAACTLYWFHPGIWWAARRLRVERELACDDRAIAAGSGCRQYADHLLEIAYAFGNHRAPALAVSMARPRQLEGRMLAALDAARNRTVPASRWRFIAAALTAALLVPIASATPAVMTEDPDAEEVQSTAIAPLLSGVRREAPHNAAVRTSGRQVASAAGASGAAVGQDDTQAPNGGGTWEIRPSGREGTIQLRLMELNSSSGSEVRADQFEGLSATDLQGAGGPVHFRLRRDAGTFSFEGVLRNGTGAGTFSFTPDPAFSAELAKRGLARPSAGEQYQLARHDIGYAFLDELNAQGYSKPQTADLVRAGQHGVHAAFVRELGALGYRLGSIAPLIELRDHGVTPAYIRELADQGYKQVPVDELRTARDHGVTVEFVRGMRDAGYKSLTLPQLVNARDHGVTPALAGEFAAAGLAGLPLEALIRARDHGVSAEYARDMRQLLRALTLDDLVAARDHGVTVAFAREMGALGYADLALESLIRLRDHGVSAKYAQELKALGYDRLTTDDLVTLRDHGLTTENVRAANARAGTKLPVDMLKSLAAGGMR